MKFSQINWQDVDVALQNKWQQLRNSSAIFQSPYYDPMYSLIVGQARSDTRFLVIEDAGEVIAFLPYQRENSFAAEVIGGGLTDYQGPICSPQIVLPTTEMLRAMNVCYMGFNHMPLVRQDFAGFAWEHSRSLTLNLDGGFAAYAQRLQEKRDASLLKKIETSERKLSKKIGPIRFFLDARQPTEFAALLAGKSDQFIRTLGTEHDIFAVPWIRSVIEAIHHKKSADFAGVLSTLYAGDTLIAAHFGMRSGTVLHYWFPWYATTYAEYSPGLILLAACAREAETLGVNLIDLGRGEQAYKLRFATGHHDLCEGAISSPQLVSQAQAAYLSLRKNLKRSRIGNYLRQYRQEK